MHFDVEGDALSGAILAVLRRRYDDHMVEGALWLVRDLIVTRCPGEEGMEDRARLVTMLLNLDPADYAEDFRRLAALPPDPIEEEEEEEADDAGDYRYIGYAA